MRKAIVLTGAVLVLAGAAATVGASSSVARSGIGAVFTGTSARVTNSWFPLKPGTIAVYTGVKNRLSAVDVFKVTHKKQVIDGVRCVVIDDRLYLAGQLAERTTDWYAQDKAGDVWYFGEATEELNPNGTIKGTAGSFQAGRNGARQGIFMPAKPRIGVTGQQEFSKGNAEDHFKILSLSARISTPGGSSRHALLTQETTPLEPGVLDHKTYVRGIGTVLEATIRGGDERLKLVSFNRG